eukprot:scaffold221815_cov22-Tisochrysis_lutea.AAC.1
MQDNETLEQITRDVVRTHPDMQFFTGESEAAELHRQDPTKKDCLRWGLPALKQDYKVVAGEACPRVSTGLHPNYSWITRHQYVGPACVKVGLKKQVTGAASCCNLAAEAQR